MKINFNDLKTQYNLFKKDFDDSISKVLENQNFIMGSEVLELEKTLSQFTGSPHSITCANGTDALQIALMAIDLQPGDEVITTPFSFISTVEVIALLGGKPVFCEIDEASYNLDAAKLEKLITPKTKAIIPVSLFGQISDMDMINSIAAKHNLTVIEDAAQSFGAIYKGKRSCNVSKIACTSFFPSKPLGCYGDGGAMFTTDEALAQKIKSIRSHGQEKKYYYQYVGLNSRLDTLQAAILNVKMKAFPEECNLRDAAGARYTELLKNKSYLKTPIISEGNKSVYAQYCLRATNRDEIMKSLAAKEIPTMIYYPHPLHLQKAFSYLGYKEGDFPITEMISKEIFSIPMSPYIKEEEQVFICQNL